MTPTKTECPHCQALRPGLPPLTARIAALPLDDRGFPIPFFVANIDGKPDFRIADRDKLIACVTRKLCWVCGQGLGAHLAFTIGTMCLINRVSAEPPTHLDCAEWSVKGCPFLSRPNMVRREDELSAEGYANAPGVMLTRNPGVTCIVRTKSYRIIKDPEGKSLFRITDILPPVTFWREGRTATRAEIMESIDSGLPTLKEMCDHEKPHMIAPAHAALAESVIDALKLLPAE